METFTLLLLDSTKEGLSGLICCPRSALHEPAVDFTQSGQGSLILNPVFRAENILRLHDRVCVSDSIIMCCSFKECEIFWQDAVNPVKPSGILFNSDVQQFSYQCIIRKKVLDVRLTDHDSEIIDVFCSFKSPLGICGASDIGFSSKQLVYKDPFNRYRQNGKRSNTEPFPQNSLLAFRGKIVDHWRDLKRCCWFADSKRGGLDLQFAEALQRITGIIGGNRVIGENGDHFRTVRSPGRCITVKGGVSFGCLIQTSVIL